LPVLASSGKNWNYLKFSEIFCRAATCREKVELCENFVIFAYREDFELVQIFREIFGRGIYREKCKLFQIFTVLQPGGKNINYFKC
jgi:hypothetical protein